MIQINPDKPYFSELARCAKELDVLAETYLARLPEITDDDVAERLWSIAHTTFPDPEAIGWENLPAWAESILDYHMPFYGPTRDGSLGHSLGSSLRSREAHLRNLLEIAEGRETEYLTFPCCACGSCFPPGHEAFDAAIAAEDAAKNKKKASRKKTVDYALAMT